MQQFTQFVMNHLVLWAILVGAVVLLVGLELQRWLSGGRGIKAQEVVNLINREHAVVVDVRSAELFQNGHIVDSINVQAENLKNNFENNIKKIAEYKNKDLVLVDADGMAAFALAEQFKKAEFSKVQVLSGGLADWRAAGLPLTKK